MSTRLFLHVASNALTGTFPTGEQSSITANITYTNANTLRTMNPTIGISQTLLSGSSQNTTSSQNDFCGFFCSNTFDVNQTVGGGGQTVTLNIANREGSSNMNLGTGLKFNVYVWRPSTGAKVGTVGDQLTLTGVAEPASAVSIRVNQGTNAATTLVNALAGDVLICEVWQIFSQASASTFTGDFYFDGTTVNTTTNSTVSNHASFLDFSADNLTFGTPSSGVTGTFSNSLAAETLSATGTALIQGSFAAITAAETLSATGTILVTGAFNQTLAAETLVTSGTALVQGSFSSLLADATLSGIGSVATPGLTGTFSNQLADFGLNSAGQVLIGGSFTQTLAPETLNATGIFIVNGSFTQTLASEILTANGTVLVTGSFSQTLAPFTLSGLGSIPANGSFTQTLADLTLSSSGTIVPPSLGTFSANLEDSALNASGIVQNALVGIFISDLQDFILFANGTVQTADIPKSQAGGGGGHGTISKKSSNRDFKLLLDKEFTPKPNRPIARIQVSVKPSTTPEPEVLSEESNDFMFLLLAVI